MADIWSTRTKPSASADIWSTRTKPSASNDFLLKEDEFYLLLETGDKIVLARGEEWSTRNKPS